MPSCATANCNRFARAEKRRATDRSPNFTQWSSTLGASRHPALEVVAQYQLDDARVAAEERLVQKLIARIAAGNDVGQRSEGRIVNQVLRMVEGIKHLGAELDALVFGEVEAFEYGQVPVVEFVRPYEVASGSGKGADIAAHPEGAGIMDDITDDVRVGGRRIDAASGDSAIFEHEVY